LTDIQINNRKKTTNHDKASLVLSPLTTLSQTTWAYSPVLNETIWG